MTTIPILCNHGNGQYCTNECPKVKIMNWGEFFLYFTYKPNFKFRYNRDEFYTFEKIIITMMVLDSRRQYREWELPVEIPVTTTLLLPPFSKEEAPRFMRSALLQIEAHEVDEWIRVQGELIFDPHKEK